MRRVLTFLAAVVLLLVSSSIGIVTADLPFWRRAFDLPLAPGETYLPTARVGVAPVGAVVAVESEKNSIDPASLEAAAQIARAAGADVLLVMRRGDLQLERFFTSPPRQFALLPADFLARPLAAIAVGIAHADGRIVSLDDPVSKYLPQWDDDPRGAITVRQLLDETSGLEIGADAADVLGTRPFADWTRLPRFATSRGVRLFLGNDFESTALGFRLEHEPGGFFNVSPVNSQLAAVVVERATGIAYEKFLEQRVLAPARFSTMELQMDRRSGMPAAHCCLRWNARDALRFVDLLRTGGELRTGYNQIRVWPPGWVAEMLKGSRANPEFGLQIEKLPGDTETWHLGGSRGGAAWVVPAEQLTVVMLAERRTPVPDGLVAELLRGLRK